MKRILVLKLQPFFSRRVSEGKRAAISKQTWFSQKRFRTYIVLALMQELLKDGKESSSKNFKLFFCEKFRQNCSYFQLQWVTTKTNLAKTAKTCGFRVYLRNHLSKKKIIYISSHPCLKSFQLNKEFFKSGHKISWYLKKRLFAIKKVALWKNPPFWKYQKLFIMDLK